MKALNWYMAPVFWVDDLADVMRELHPEEDWDDLRQAMFGDQYMNDVYVSFYFADPWEYHDGEWENEEYCRMKNMVREYLMKMFPGHERVIVDVMW